MSAIKLDILDLSADRHERNFTTLGHIQGGKSTTKKEDAEQYLFGFNGMEKDNEIKGSGNSYDYGARIYDSRLGRFLSVDAYSSLYVQITPYAFSLNNPNIFRDADGNVVVGSNGKAVTYKQTTSGEIIWSSNATADVKRIGNAMLKTETGKTQLDKMVNSSIKVHMIISPEIVQGVNDKGQETTTHGIAQEGNKIAPNFGQIVNDEGEVTGITEATITIYEGSILETLKNSTESNLSGLSVDEAIGAVAAHESVHATDKKEIKKSLDNRYKGTKNNLEIKPEEIEIKVTNETKALDPSKREIPIPRFPKELFPKRIYIED